MAKNNLEDELRNLKNIHLTESELSAYCDQELGLMGRARAEAHLKRCFLCERRLALLREESAALDQRQVSAEDGALVERPTQQFGSEETTSDARPAAKEISLQERLTDYLRRMAASLQVAFKPVRGEALWSWQSVDCRLQARATMEKNADMTIHFSSTEMELEGARLHFRLGELDRETTLRRVSESEVAGQVAIPWQYRQSSTPDISIEIV
jgi:hypothetical protein